MDWILGLLPTFTHHTELHVITALSLISTFYISLAHTKPSQSSLVVSWQRTYNSLTVTTHFKCQCTTAHMKFSLHNCTTNSQSIRFHLFSVIFDCILKRLSIIISEQSRAEQSRSLLPAISRHGHSWHRAPVGPVAIYLWMSRPLCFFFPSLILLNDKEEGVGLFFSLSRCFLTTP
jgi:hypothetical protein